MPACNASEKSLITPKARRNPEAREAHQSLRQLRRSLTWYAIVPATTVTATRPITSPGPVFASRWSLAAAGVVVAVEEVRDELADWLVPCSGLFDAEELLDGAEAVPPEADGLAVLPLPVVLVLPAVEFDLFRSVVVPVVLLFEAVLFALSWAACCDLRNASVAVLVGLGALVFFGLGLRQKRSHKTNQTTPAIMSRDTINQIILPMTEGRFCSYILTISVSRYHHSTNRMFLQIVSGVSEIVWCLSHLETAKYLFGHIRLVLLLREVSGQIRHNLVAEIFGRTQDDIGHEAFQRFKPEDNAGFFCGF